MFVNLRGEFECVRCRQVSDTPIQTYVLRAEADNCGRDYRVGDSEVMNGLDNYYPLHPWVGGSPLVVAVGDWDCDYCRLAWQWARAVFDVQPSKPHPVVTLRELVTFQPWQPDAFDGVHFIQPYLAAMSGLWPSSVGWSEELRDWQACSVSERCERVSAGFREWCREVAGGGPEGATGNSQG